MVYIWRQIGNVCGLKIWVKPIYCWNGIQWIECLRFQVAIYIKTNIYRLPDFTFPIYMMCDIKNIFKCISTSIVQIYLFCCFLFLFRPFESNGICVFSYCVWQLYWFLSRVSMLYTSEILFILDWLSFKNHEWIPKNRLIKMRILNKIGISLLRLAFDESIYLTDFHSKLKLNFFFVQKDIE